MLAHATLTTCPNCIEPAARRTTPHGETYVLCTACGAITFDGGDPDDESTPDTLTTDIARDLLAVCETINTWLGTDDGAQAIPFEPPWYQRFHMVIAQANRLLPTAQAEAFVRREAKESAPHTPQALSTARAALEAAEVATTEARAAALPSQTRPRVLWAV